MKGLAFFPDQKDLQATYRRLQNIDDKEVKLSELALWSQWTRLDARLAEILVKWLATEWKNISAIQLNEELKKQVWPMVMGVLLDQTLEFYIEKKDHNLFKNWKECAMSDIPKKYLGQFFITFRNFSSPLVRKQIFYTLNFYDKWGFLGNELFVTKTKLRKKSYLSKKRREVLLKQFLKGKTRVTVNEYLNFLNHLVSRRVAEMDLKNSKQLTGHGKTLGKTYSVKRAKLMS